MLLDRTASKRPEHQTAQVAKEPSTFDIHVAVLSETRLALQDSIVDHRYTFIWSGKGERQRRQAEVRFATRNRPKVRTAATEISDKISSMRILLQGNVWVTIISIYTSTMTSSENQLNFYNRLVKTVREVPSTDKLIIA